MNVLRLVIAVCFLVAPSIAARAETLPIRPMVQRTPVWCWAAVGAMVFAYHRVPRLFPGVEDQCSIVGGLGGACAVNCYNCRITAGQMSTMVRMLDQYPELVRETGRDAARLESEQAYRPLGAEEVAAEIDARRPVIAGISPSGAGYPDNVAEHVALIVGYERDETTEGDEVLFLIVNDPYPFGLDANPYTRAGGERIDFRGRYRIAHEVFVAELRWTESVFGITAEAETAPTGATETQNPLRDPVPDRSGGEGSTQNPLRDPNPDRSFGDGPTTNPLRDP